MRAITFSLLILFSVSAFATDGLFTSIHHQYESPRALGMGDAFVAVANDYSALFYNPAGLGKLDEGQINLSLDVAGSASFASFYKDVQDITKITDTTAQTNAYIDLLQKNYGKQFSIRTGLFEGIWVHPGWGVGLIPADLSVDFAVHNQSAPALSARVYADSTLAMGYGARVRAENIPGQLFWGTTAKFVNRGFFSRDINVLDLAADSNLVSSNDLREGYTVDADLGFLFTPYIPTDGFWSLFELAHPTFGAVIRNVGQTGFGRSLKLLNKTPSGTEDAPEPLYRVLDVGTRWEYPSFWIFSGRGTMDLRDIGHPNFSLRKGFHIGGEFDWSLFSWWKGQYRLGVNEGYPTFGLSALFTIFRLDLVTYGEDIGFYNSPKENRMYMVKMNIDL